MAARSAGRSRGSNTNSRSNAIPAAWKWSRRSEVLNIATVSSVPAYVARASSHCAENG